MVKYWANLVDMKFWDSFVYSNENAKTPNWYTDMEVIKVQKFEIMLIRYDLSCRIYFQTWLTILQDLDLFSFCYGFVTEELTSYVCSWMNSSLS